MIGSKIFSNLSLKIFHKDRKHAEFRWHAHKTFLMWKTFYSQFFCLLASYVADNIAKMQNAIHSYENELWRVKICSYLFIQKKRAATDYQATFINLFVCAHIVFISFIPILFIVYVWNKFSLNIRQLINFSIAAEWKNFKRAFIGWQNKSLIIRMEKEP